jgi:NAD(P)H-flavin reductase
MNREATANPAPYEAILRKVRFTNERTKHFEFEISNGHKFSFLPGQFISLDLNVRGERERRPYSIASAPREDNRFDLCLNMLPAGRVSSWLFALKPGDAIRFTGPLGFFTLREPPDPVSAFIATGTGIAPIRAMLQQLYRDHQARESWLIFGVRGEPDILYRDEFERLAAQNPAFHFIPTLSRPHQGWKGHAGYVQQQVAKYLRDKKGLHTYLCGLDRMVRDVAQELRLMGYDPKSFSFERYD